MQGTIKYTEERDTEESTLFSRSENRDPLKIVKTVALVAAFGAAGAAVAKAKDSAYLRTAKSSLTEVSEVADAASSSDTLFVPEEKSLVESGCPGDFGAREGSKQYSCTDTTLCWKIMSSNRYWNQKCLMDNSQASKSNAQQCYSLYQGSKCYNGKMYPKDCQNGQTSNCNAVQTSSGGGGGGCTVM